MKPVDYVVMTMVCIVGFVVCVPLINSVATGDKNPESAELIAGLVASLIAIVSIYVGAKLRDKHDDG
jgi:hypothetical protein